MTPLLPSPPTPELLEELVEEILLRLPPDNPASLFRAALVCRLWRHLVSGAGFRRRFREFHHTPPLLGVICNEVYRRRPFARFLPTSSFRPARPDKFSYRAIDARHGRVLLHNTFTVYGRSVINFSIWDPITGDLQELPSLLCPVIASKKPRGWNAAVLCAAGHSDHLGCSFMVVFVGIEYEKMFVDIYAPAQESKWIRVASTRRRYRYDFFKMAPGVVVGNTLYFLALGSNGIVKVDMATWEISVIDLVHKFFRRNSVLMTTEDGRLGVASVYECKLYLWSMEVGSNCRDAPRFVVSRVLDLEKLLPVNTSPRANGFADGVRILFMRTNDGLYCIDLNTEQARKGPDCNTCHDVVPYLNFHTPGLSKLEVKLMIEEGVRLLMECAQKVMAQQQTRPAL
ncbi:unnamed protein product [Urochloa decumbens]|uniref:F-box domain-containing protein n=1 Tax=Urochloa decumbens TaxID=240449 RepID=A0ABC9GEK0_9POAL